MTSRFPRWLRGTPLESYVLHFEAEVERFVGSFANGLPAGWRVLDAGAGEGQYTRHFSRHRYTAVDLAVGDSEWDYSRLQVIADLTALPFAGGSFDAAINIATLEHVREPARALREISHSLRPGGRFLLVVPHEWEVHQEPHDFFRFTRHGVRFLLEESGFDDIRIEAVGGFFRLLSRRLLNGLQFFPPLLFPIAALLLAPPALILPALDALDHRRDFTLGYICTSKKSL